MAKISKAKDSQKVTDDTLARSATEEMEERGNNIDQPKLPPEEGFQGWLCVIGAFICLFCSFGFLNACVATFQVLHIQC